MNDINKSRRQQFFYPELYQAATKGLSNGLEKYPGYLASIDPLVLEYVASRGDRGHFLFKFTDEQNHVSSPTHAGYFWRMPTYDRPHGRCQG